MVWNLITALLGVLVPLFYSWLTSKYPGFPLDAESVMAVILWIAGLLVSGSSGTMAYVKKQIEKSVTDGKPATLGEYKLHIVEKKKA